MVSGIVMNSGQANLAFKTQGAVLQRIVTGTNGWHGRCNCPIAMKNTFLSIFAVIATASALQASEPRAVVLPEFDVSANQMQFIDSRLEAVVDEQIAKALAEPIPASVLARVDAQPRTSFLIAKHAKAGAPSATNNS